MKIALQLLLNDFISGGATVHDMYEVMDALDTALFYRECIARRELKGIQVYDETRQRLADAEKMAESILKRQGYGYPLDDLL